MEIFAHDKAKQKLVFHMNIGPINLFVYFTKWPFCFLDKYFDRL